MEESLLGDFSMTIKVVHGDSSWWFSGVYGPCRSRERNDFWDELAGLGEICGENWCVGGDFNVVRFASEKNKTIRARRSMRCFNEIIAELSLIDPPLSNGEYTWSNFRENPTCSRLDRFLLSPGWRRIFPYYQQEVQLRGVSDHFPLIITTDMATWGPGPFRFDNDWLDNPEFKDLVSTTWSEAVSAEWSGHRIMGKLCKLKNKIKAWSAGERERRYGQKLNIEKEITRLDRVEWGDEWT